MTLTRLFSVVATLAATAALTAVAASPAAAQPVAPRDQLSQFSCQNALDPSNRSVSVESVMRPVTGTLRMAVKFQLLEGAVGTLPTTVVRGTGLNAWLTPDDPTLGQLPGDVWQLTKSVINLGAPAVYAFHASFRWTGAHGRVLHTAQRTTRTCRQRELRPDLLVKSLTITPIAAQPGEDLYTAVIGNRGLTGAGPFEVLFDPADGTAPTIDTIAWLGSRQSRTLSFVGPACNAAQPPTVTADAADQVDDYDRANNEMTATCPATTSDPSGP